MSPQFTTVFLLIASLLTAMVLGLEILHSFTAFLPPRILQALEWQIYLHSSALAFGSVLFVLYQLFVLLLFALFSCSVRVLKSCGIAGEIELRGGNEEDIPLKEEKCTRIPWKLVSSAILVTVLILNDAIYNRVEGSPLIRGSFDRLLAIIFKALPMTLFEMPALIALVCLISCWLDERPKTTNIDLEAQAPVSTTQYRSDAKLPGFFPEKSSGIAEIC